MRNRIRTVSSLVSRLHSPLFVSSHIMAEEGSNLLQGLLKSPPRESVISLENVVQHFNKTASTETKLALGITDMKRKREITSMANNSGKDCKVSKLLFDLI